MLELSAEAVEDLPAGGLMLSQEARRQRKHRCGEALLPAELARGLPVQLGQPSGSPQEGGAGSFLQHPPPPPPRAAWPVSPRGGRSSSQAWSSEQPPAALTRPARLRCWAVAAHRHPGFPSLLGVCVLLPVLLGVHWQ